MTRVICSCRDKMLPLGLTLPPLNLLIELSLNVACP